MLAVCQVFNAAIDYIRPIHLLSLVRDELELKVFGRTYLTKKLMKNVKFFSIVIFIYHFELYRNIYRSVTRVYAISAWLSIKNRQKSSNTYIVTFSLYDSNFDKVMSCFQTSLGAFNWSSVLEINGRKQSVWVSVLRFIRDMK